ncbi:MAG: Na+/H+ antiporter NhaC family protein [Cytophagales bacterium]|nr:Na+/H+ antiporter NhaC family protein [Cytophagales bacterium]
MHTETENRKGNFWALSPLFIFLGIYLGVSLISGDFYKMPVIVSFLIASLSALAMNPRQSLNEKLTTFAKGAGNADIMLMSLIFILAGAFASAAKEIGAIESTVNLGLNLLPGNVFIVGVFAIGCFISLSIGTSVGTVAALTPVAVGIAQTTEIPLALALGAVVGGAMFGDNLSIISDTTIAAAKTQGCDIRDKFRMNVRIVLPAAILASAVFYFLSNNYHVADQARSYSMLKVAPYIIVLAAALLGVNVVIVLLGGTIVTGLIGFYTGSFDFWGFADATRNGIQSMTELVVICMLIGGMVELIKANGGIQFLLYRISKKIKNTKSAELGIAALVFFVNLCTANNTVSILTAGPIAKQIADDNQIDPRRSASLLDTFSCFTQGTIPYGAQLLTAVSIAGAELISPFEIMQYLVYPYLMGVFALLFILRKKQKTQELTIRNAA